MQLLLRYLAPQKKGLTETNKQNSPGFLFFYKRKIRQTDKQQKRTGCSWLTKLLDRSTGQQEEIISSPHLTFVRPQFHVDR